LTGKFHSSKALWLVLAVFLLSVGLRAPQLIRPLSHHHESISALQLITMESWKQAGGPATLNYIPVFNYQQPGDKRVTNQYNIDSAGNEIYISYGTGWNLLPYYSFSLLHIAPAPLALRLFDVCVGLVSCLLLFRLMLLLPGNDDKKYEAAAIACIAFMFTPGTLWYFGNVYVNCSVAIPFILAFLYCLLRMILHTQTIRPLPVILLFLLVICLLSIDWIGAFLAFTSAIVLLWKIKTTRSLLYPLLAIVLGAAAGLGLIVWQFVSYLGTAMAWNNLTGKFHTRTMHSSDGVFRPLAAIATHFATASLPLIALLIITWLAARRYKKAMPPSGNTRLLFIILLPALLLYNASFLSWTRHHEFSILYYSILFAIAAGRLLPQVWSSKKIAIALVSFVTLAAVEYYLVNPPGSKSLNGEAYDLYRQLGETIVQKARPGQAVFTNFPLLPPAEFYAKRKIDYAASLAEAKRLLSYCRATEGVWIEQKALHIIRVEVFH
jgi:hypothetical protein